METRGIRDQIVIATKVSGIEKPYFLTDNLSLVHHKLQTRSR